MVYPPKWSLISSTGRAQDSESTRVQRPMFYRWTTATVLSNVAKWQLTTLNFRVSRRRHEMYCGHARLCVCLSIRGRMPTLLHGPGCNLGEW